MNAKYVYTFRSQQGLQLKVRPLRPDDVPYLVDLFEHMGPDSRYLRFNQALNDPDTKMVRAEAQRLAQVDQSRDGAWIVFADLPGQENAPVAGMRYVRTGPDSAEASLVVRDDVQDQGIGTQLLIFLTRQAADAGIRHLTGTVQAANRRIWRILHKANIPYERELQAGYAHVVAEIDKMQPAIEK